MFARLAGGDTEGDSHWEVVAPGERLTAGAIDNCFVCRIGHKKVVKLEMGRTAFRLQKVGIKGVISRFFFPCGCGGEVVSHCFFG